MTPTRARLVVLIAGAIVFSPGAPLGEDSTRQGESQVAAGMLAPTFEPPDLAAYGVGTPTKNALDHRPPPTLAALIGAVIFACARFARSPSELTHGRLRRFVFPHRDRGPPHLQPV